jgi:parvulin-like peptidyl-prolyl isomerase
MDSPSRVVAVPWFESGHISLALWVAGALFGLLAAGFSLFTAKGTATSAVSPEYIAVVNQRPLYVSDYLDALKAQFNVTIEQATIEQRRKVLDDMIREELFVQRGLELDEPGTDPDVRNALVAAVQAQIAVDATSQIPNEAELTAFYRDHVERYSSIGYLMAADLLAAPDVAGGAAEASLTSAAAALRAGQPLAAVKAQFGLQQSAESGGEQVYFAAKLHMGERLFAAVAPLAAGQVAGPIKADDGRLHLVYMIANHPPQPRDFAMARNEVYGDYRQDLLNRIRDREFKYLKDKADIRINRAYRP